MPILTVRIGIFYEEFMCSVWKPNEIKKILIFLKEVIRIFNINFGTITERREKQYE